MTCPPDPPTDGYLLGPRCLSSKWVLMSAGAIPHSAQWLNWSDPIDIDSVTFKAITLSQRWTSHHGYDSDSWLATNYKQEGAEALLGRAGPVVRVRGVGERAGRDREMERQEERKQRKYIIHSSSLQHVVLSILNYHPWVYLCFASTYVSYLNTQIHMYTNRHSQINIETSNR